MLADKVEAVEGIAARLRTPRTIFEVPAVLRLLPLQPTQGCAVGPRGRDEVAV
jgi:hypothetical protein